MKHPWNYAELGRGKGGGEIKRETSATITLSLIVETGSISGKLTSFSSMQECYDCRIFGDGQVDHCAIQGPPEPGTDLDLLELFKVIRVIRIT